MMGPETLIAVCPNCGHKQIVPFTTLIMVCSKCGQSSHYPDEKP